MRRTPLERIGERVLPKGVSRVKVLRFEYIDGQRYLSGAFDVPNITHTRVDVVREGSPKHLQGGFEPGIYVQCLRSNVGADHPGPPTVVREVVLPRDGDGIIMLDADNVKLDSYFWPLRKRGEYAEADAALAAVEHRESAEPPATIIAREANHDEETPA